MKNEIEYQGVLYSSEKQMCESIGLRYETYGDRKYKGWSFEECINGRDKKCNVITYNGITYNSERVMCETLGVSYNNYSGRKYKGWTLEECIYGKRETTDILRTVLQMITTDSVTFDNLIQLPTNIIEILDEYNYINWECIDKKSKELLLNK